MEPIAPDITGLVPEGSTALVFAEQQRGYLPLPAVVTPDGRVLTRWTFTGAERQAIANGTDVYLCVWSYGRSLHPLELTVGPRDWRARADRRGTRESTTRSGGRGPIDTAADRRRGAPDRRQVVDGSRAP